MNDDTGTLASTCQALAPSATGCILSPLLLMAGLPPDHPGRCYSTTWTRSRVVMGGLERILRPAGADERQFQSEHRGKRFVTHPDAATMGLHRQPAEVQAQSQVPAADTRTDPGHQALPGSVL